MLGESCESHTFTLLHMVEQRCRKASLACHLLTGAHIRIDEILQGLLHGTMPQRVPCGIGVVAQQTKACALAKQGFEVRTTRGRVKVESSEVAQRQKVVYDQLLPRWHKGTGFKHLAEQRRLHWVTLTDSLDELPHQGREVSLHQAGKIMDIWWLARGSGTGGRQEVPGRYCSDVFCVRECLGPRTFVGRVASHVPLDV